MSPRLCLNMIVRNEIANLPRCLDSTVGHIHCAVIFDTGSTDGTVEYIRAHCKRHRIPCHITTGKFVDFEQARNRALAMAKHYHVGFDYILLMDADMELKVDGPLPALTAESYCLLQRQGSLDYHNVRLLRKNSGAQYHGVTHEYLGANEQLRLPGDVWWFQDHATGSNRPEKYERDKRLLEGYLTEHPNDGRSLFYLAQTYRDAGAHAKAIDLYRRRIDAGGWDEEIWYARYQIALAFKSLGNEPEFVTNALIAFNARPSRAEPLHALARYFREKKDQQQSAWLFAEAGAKLPYPGDMLFVDRWMYDWGFLEEKSILGSYVAGKRDEGAKACNQLSLHKGASGTTRENARRNMFWYVDALRAHCPSFQAVRIPDVNPDKTYANTNPSVAVVGNELKAIVRTVSYRIRPDGTYDYNGLSAIRTTNFLVDLDDNFTVSNVVELKRPTGFPDPVFRDVLDVEDMRLIPYNGELWANACVLEQNSQAWREQFLMKLNSVTGEVTDWHRIDPAFVEKRNEKNWMPILDGGHLKWMYSPGVVMSDRGQRIVQQENTLAVDDFSGGGQLVPMDTGFLGIVHTARPDPTNGKRYYWHRFVYFDHNYQLQKVSQPFVFFDKQIEFAAGLVLNGGKVIVSFGVLDREAWVASIDEHEVRDLLWRS